MDGFKGAPLPKDYAYIIEHEYGEPLPPAVDKNNEPVEIRDGAVAQAEGILIRHAAERSPDISLLVKIGEIHWVGAIGEHIVAQGDVTEPYQPLPRKPARLKRLGAGIIKLMAGIADHPPMGCYMGHIDRQPR